jgi:hypothetical protein
LQKIAALDQKGRLSFQLLQIFKSSENVPPVYYVFDILSLDGKDLREQPLTADSGEFSQRRIREARQFCAIRRN